MNLNQTITEYLTENGITSSYFGNEKKLIIELNGDEEIKNKMKNLNLSFGIEKLFKEEYIEGYFYLKLLKEEKIKKFGIFDLSTTKEDYKKIRIKKNMTIKEKLDEIFFNTEDIINYIEEIEILLNKKLGGKYIISFFQEYDSYPNLFFLFIENKLNKSKKDFVFSFDDFGKCSLNKNSVSMRMINIETKIRGRFNDILKEEFGKETQKNFSNIGKVVEEIFIILGLE